MLNFREIALCGPLDNVILSGALSLAVSVPFLSKMSGETKPPAKFFYPSSVSICVLEKMQIAVLSRLLGNRAGKFNGCA